MTVVDTNVAAVTVTYGDRFATICRATVERALADGVTRILIVDNGSSASSAQAMDEFANAESRITIIRNGKNEGSARAFRTGMLWAGETDAELVWLLDDDNAVEKGTLRALLAARDEARSEYGDRVIMAPRRVPNALHQRIAEGYPLPLVYPRSGAFLGFDVLGAIGRRLRSLQRRTGAASRVIPVPYAPYGGLLVSREVLTKEALPDERLQLYVDDTVWTAELSRSGYPILLVLEVVITDLDDKWTSAGRGNSLATALRSPRRDRLYLSTRNRVLFDHGNVRGVGSRLRYVLNRSAIMAFAVLSSMRHGEWAGLRVFRTAVRDGERSDLSRTFNL